MVLRPHTPTQSTIRSCNNWDWKTPKSKTCNVKTSKSKTNANTNKTSMKLLGPTETYIQKIS